MLTKEYGKSNNMYKPIRIQRITESELNIAISDLEERGFRLIKRGAEESEHKNFNYRENKGQKFKYSDSEVHRKCWAIMQRID